MGGHMGSPPPCHYAAAQTLQEEVINGRVSMTVHIRLLSVSAVFAARNRRVSLFTDQLWCDGRSIRC